MALQAILASPRFLFRLEEAPATARAGQSYRITDLDLASRLSFFLWGAGPDDELLKMRAARHAARPRRAGGAGQAHAAPIRESDALATALRRQWLRLQDLEKIYPDALLFPTSTSSSARRSGGKPSSSSTASSAKIAASLDLLTADYTFVNERIARHYGIPNVYGSSSGASRSPTRIAAACSARAASSR